jgi:hypothetical protein
MRVRDYSAALRKGGPAAEKALAAALVDGQRFARGMSAWMPIAEARGACVWSLVGDVLGHVVPIAPGLDDLETAAQALRLVVRLVLDGERLRARMDLGQAAISIDGVQGGIDLRLAEGVHEISMRFAVSAAGARLLGPAAVRRRRSGRRDAPAAS